MVVIEELVELESGGAFKWQVSQNNGQLGKFSGFSHYFIPESDELGSSVNGVNRVFKCSSSLQLSIE